jgi:hypothetical protein
MAKGIRRRTVYAATIVAALAMVGGYVVAFTITPILQAPQNGSFGAANTVNGVNTPAMQLLIAGATNGPTTATQGSPFVLGASGTSTLYVNLVSQQDYFEQVTVTFAWGSTTATGVPANQGYEITLDVNLGGSSTPVNVFVISNPSFSSGTVTLSLDYDVGSGSGGITVTSVSDLVTQCTMSGTTLTSCP